MLIAFSLLAGCGGIGPVNGLQSTASHDDTRVIVNRQVEFSDPGCKLLLLQEAIYTDAVHQIFKVEYDAKIDGMPESVIYSMVPPAADDAQDDALHAEVYGPNGEQSFVVLVSGKNHELKVQDGKATLVDVEGFGRSQSDARIDVTSKIADENGLTLLGCALPARLPDPQLKELATPRFLDNIANTTMLAGNVTQASETKVPIDPNWPADLTVVDAVRLMGGLTAQGFEPGCWSENGHNIGWCPSGS